MNIKDFVNEHQSDDVNALRLKYCSGKSTDDSARKMYDDAITQIECRRKFSAKLKSFVNCDDFRFPSVLAGEQASHEAVARYHASLVDGVLSLLDMTAGLGVDFMLMAERVSASGGRSIAIEVDQQKVKCLEDNIASLNIAGAYVLNGDSMSYLLSDGSSDDAHISNYLCDIRNDSLLDNAQHKDSKFNLIFVDPARRGEGDKRLYDPARCVPDITGRWHDILNLCDRILVKNSPMLDIHRALSLYPGVKRIHLVSVKNECKEVLVEAGKDEIFAELVCINISDSKVSSVRISSYEYFQINDIVSPMADSIDSIKESFASNSLYLYEPDSSILKAGVISVLQSRYMNEGTHICRLSKNCNLLISDRYIKDFPGRILNNLRIIEGKEIKSLQGGRYNVVCRDYPVKADILQKRLKVIPGSSEYIYGARVGEKRTPVLIAGTDVSVAYDSESESEFISH